MRSLSRPFAAVAFATMLVVGATPAWAASHKGGGGGGGGGGGTTTGTGIDVSYPQCPGTSLPPGEAFAIVSVTGGLANDYNSCLSNEFAYAQQTTGTTKQPKAQLYVNTADPGNGVADWPSPSQPGAFGSSTTPYGSCTYASASATSGPGADSAACAYVYGYDMVAGIAYGGGNVIGDLADFHNVTGGYMYQYPVWLDVETTNSWQSSTTSNGLAMNTADLQGMVEAFKAATPSGLTSTVGVYSTGYQWNQITGTPTGTAAGDLAGLPDWVPGATRQSGAVSNCSTTPFTGGRVTVTQWTSQYDYDYSCVG